MIIHDEKGMNGGKKKIKTLFFFKNN